MTRLRYCKGGFWLKLFVFIVFVTDIVQTGQTDLIDPNNDQIDQIDSITELAAFRGRRSRNSKLECLFPTEYAGRCITSPKSGRDLCYPELALLDYSCVSKTQNGRRSVPPPKVMHGQYKALITKFEPLHVPSTRKNGSSKPFLVVQYQCNQGYEFLDEAEFLFCRDYQWVQTPPVCVPSEFAAEYRKKDNPCQENNGDCSHICRNLGGGLIKCECPVGMFLEPDGTCRETDLCQVNNGGCSHFCINSDEPGAMPRCSCPAEFTLRADGKTCIEEASDVSEFLPEKPGSCPQVAFGWPDQKCVGTCRRDQECTGQQKCCNNGCAWVCMVAEPGIVVKPITECTTTVDCRCEVVDEIRQRCTCPPGITCFLTRTAPDVSISPSGPIDVRPGSPLNLTCHASGFPFPNVTWFKDNAPMAQTNGMHGEKTVQKRLVIKELFKSTVFSCEAVNDVGGNTAEVQVLVTGPGSPPDKITAKVNGTTVTIKWKAPTLPNGQIKGYQVYYIEKDARKPLREWKTVGTVEPRAVIHDLNPETKYFFRIVPYNERGSGIMTNIFSVRTEKHEILPTVTIVEGDSYKVEPGGSVNLTCQIGGYPPPSAAWYQNGNRLQEAAVVSVLKTAYENALETTVFECRASNLKGFANTSIRVEVSGPGSAPGQIQYRVDGVNVEISWGAPEFPNGEIEGYTLHYTTNPHLPIEEWDVEIILKQQTITLSDLKPGTTYFGRIKAFNENPGPLSEMFTVLTGLKNVPPKVRILGIDGLRVEVAPGGQVNLTCVASGIPEPSVSWKQDGEALRSFHHAGPGDKEVSKTIVTDKILETTAFSCEATNNVGSDSVRVDVAVTGPGSPPENIDVSFEENSILIKWQEPIIPNGHVLGYNIYYTTNRTLPQSSWQKFSVPSSGYQSQAIMHDLQEDTTYHIRIAGYTNLGEGVISQIHQSRTGKKSSQPKVSLQPPDTVISISPGASYTVTCTADGHPDPNLSWYRDGQPVAYRTVLENTKVIAAVLTVESLLKTSVFTCRAINTLGTSTKEIIIEVKGPGSSPRSIRYSAYSTTVDLQWEQPEITNGQIIGYEIIYTLEPTDDLNSWFKVNLGVKNQHKLSRLSPSRPYTFRIRAINTKGPGPWSPPFLAVTGGEEVKPTVAILPEGDIYYASPGGTVNLTCQTEGFPEPVVQWYEHGRPIPHEPGSSVTITKEKVFESSMFECRATNAVGFARKVVNVEVAGPGEAPLRFEASVKGTTIEASWMPPRITNGNLQSYAVYYTTNPNLDIPLWETIRVPTKPPHESPFYDIIISSLPPNTTYYLKVQAISDRGPGVLSAPLTVKTSDQGFSLNASVRPEGPIEVPLNGGVELICEATGYPTPMVTWRKGDHPITSAQPNKNTFFIDGVSGKITLECFAENDAGRTVKVAHIFASEKLEEICNPKPSFGMDGNYVIKWPDLKSQVQKGSRFIILFTTRGELSLDMWNSIETSDPSLVLLPNLQGGQRYFVRMKILSPEDDKSVVCGVFTTVVPTLPKVVVFTRVKNETKLHWGTVHIPDENIEKIFVRYTYEPHLIPYEEWPTVPAEATAREVILPNIRPSIVYTIRLEFVTEKGESFHSVQYEVESPDFDDCEYAECQQICDYDPEVNAAVCGCGPGYELNDDKKTCSPVEELEDVKNVTGPTRRPSLGCSDDNGGCDQLCEEIKAGVIKCSCTPGFELTRDGKSCRRAPPVRPHTARPKIDVCQLPMDPGPCEENNFVWFYDPTTESCVQFTYGGCDGNANRFFSREQCMDRCSEKPCHQKRKEAILQQLDFLPECNQDGDFVSTQCDVSGVCWCVNPEDGMEVAGSRYTEDQGKPYCKSCLFEWHHHINKGEVGAFIPSCNEDGLYNLVQCHASTGHCWCVDQLTGLEVPNTRVPAGVKVSCTKPTPAKPGDVRVVLTLEDNLKFRFVLQPNITAKKYILYYTDDPEQPANKWQVIEIEKPFTDDGFERPNFLTPNKTYSFKITPIFEDGLGECSDVVYVHTTLNIPPQPPTIREENVEPESALIKWDRDPIIDTPDVNHYNVYLAEIETGLKHQIHKIHAWDEIPLTLKPGTAYLVYITAVNDFGESPQSNRIDFKTPTIKEFTGKPRATTPKSVDEAEKVTKKGIDEEEVTTSAEPKVTAKVTSAKEKITPTRVRGPTTKKPKVTPKVTPLKEVTPTVTPVKEDVTPKHIPGKEPTTKKPSLTPKVIPEKEPTTKKPSVTPKVTPSKEKVTPKPIPGKEPTTKKPKVTPKVTPSKEKATTPGQEPTTKKPKVTPKVTPFKERITPKVTLEKEKVTPKPIPGKEQTTKKPKVTPVPGKEPTTMKPGMTPDTRISLTPKPVEVPTKLPIDLKTTELPAELVTKREDEEVEKFTTTPKKDISVDLTTLEQPVKATEPEDIEKSEELLTPEVEPGSTRKDFDLITTARPKVAMTEPEEVEVEPTEAPDVVDKSKEETGTISDKELATKAVTAKVTGEPEEGKPTEIAPKITTKVPAIAQTGEPEESKEVTPEKEKVTPKTESKEEEEITEKPEKAGTLKPSLTPEPVAASTKEKKVETVAPEGAETDEPETEERVQKSTVKTSIDDGEISVSPEEKKMVTGTEVVEPKLGSTPGEPVEATTVRPEDKKEDSKEATEKPEKEKDEVVSPDIEEEGIGSPTGKAITPKGITTASAPAKAATTAPEQEPMVTGEEKVEKATAIPGISISTVEAEYEEEVSKEETPEKAEVEGTVEPKEKLEETESPSEKDLVTPKVPSVDQTTQESPLPIKLTAETEMLDKDEEGVTKVAEVTAKPIPGTSKEEPSEKETEAQPKVTPGLKPVTDMEKISTSKEKSQEEKDVDKVSTAKPSFDKTTAEGKSEEDKETPEKDDEKVSPKPDEEKDVSVFPEGKTTFAQPEKDKATSVKPGKDMDIKSTPKVEEGKEISPSTKEDELKKVTPESKEGEISEKPEEEASPKPDKSKEISPQPTDTEEKAKSPKPAESEEEASPKPEVDKDISAKPDKTKETSPMTDKEVSPKPSEEDEKVASPKPGDDEDKEASPKPDEDEGKKASTKPGEDKDREVSPKPDEDEGKKASTKPGEDKDREVSPKPGEDEDKKASPKESKEVSPQPDVSPKPEKSKEISPEPDEEDEEKKLSLKPEEGDGVTQKTDKSKDTSLEPEEDKDISPKPTKDIEVSPKPDESKELSPAPDESEVKATPRTPEEDITGSIIPEEEIKSTVIPKKEEKISPKPEKEVSPEYEEGKVSLKPGEDKEEEASPKPEDEDKEASPKPEDEDKEASPKPEDEDKEASPKPEDEDKEASPKPEDVEKEVSPKPADEDEEVSPQPEEISPKPDEERKPSPKSSVTPLEEKPVSPDQRITPKPSAVVTTEEDLLEQDEKMTSKRTRATPKVTVKPKATPIAEASTLAPFEIISQETAKPTKTLKAEDQIKHIPTLPAVLTPEQCDNMDGPMDIVFVLDLSNHIRPQDHKLMVAKITEIIDKNFVIGPDTIRVAFIQYSDTVQVTVRLGDYNTKAELVEAIQSSEHMKGGTVTADALSEANRVLKSGRPHVFQVVVLITDGGSVSDPTQAAKVLEDEGIQIIAAGVGPSVDPEEVAQLAGVLHEDKSEFYAESVRSFTQQIAQHVVLRICNYIQLYETEKTTAEPPEAETPKPDEGLKTIQPGVEPSTGKPAVQPSTGKPAKPTTKKPVIKPSTVKPGERASTAKPAKSTTKKPAVKPSTAKPGKPTTKKPAVKPSTAIPGVQPSTAKPAKPTTKRPAVKPSTEKPDVQSSTVKPAKTTTKKSAVKPSTVKPVLRPSTTKPDVQPSTGKPALEPSTEKHVVQPSTEKPADKPTPAESDVEPTGVAAETRTEKTPQVEPKTDEPGVSSLEPKSPSVPSDMKSTEGLVEKPMTEKPGKFLPGAVTVISADFVGSDKIEVKWDVSEKQTVNWKFIIDYTRISDKEKGKSEVGGELRETYISGATCEDYEIIIHAVNENGFGVNSEPIVVKCEKIGVSTPESEGLVTQKPEEVLDAKKATTAKERVSPKIKPTGPTGEESEEESTEPSPSELSAEKRTPSEQDEKLATSKEMEPGKLTSPGVVGEVSEKTADTLEPLKGTVKPEKSKEDEQSKEDEKSKEDVSAEETSLAPGHTKMLVAQTKEPIKATEKTEEPEKSEEQSLPSQSTKPAEKEKEDITGVTESAEQGTRAVTGVTESADEVTPAVHKVTEEPESSEEKLPTPSAKPGIKEKDVTGATKSAEEATPADSGEEGVTSEIGSVTGAGETKKATESSESSESSEELTKSTRKAFTGEGEEEDIESDGVTGATQQTPTPPSAYEQFTTSIPSKDVVVAPKCNCTCRIIVKTKRGKCYFEDDDGDDELQVIVDDKGLQGKDCNDTKSVGKPKQRGPYEIDRTPVEVPEDQESDCPCVKPLRGDMCPPGFLLKGGKCRDINECAYKNGGCSHGCVNTVGEYYCACPPGMHRDMTDVKQCLDQESFYKKLGQLLYHHLWNQAKLNNGRAATIEPIDDKTLRAKYQSHPKNTNRAIARLSNGTNTMKLEWEWQNFLKKFRH